MKNCRACVHSYMEPSDMNLICGHPDAGTFGLTIRSEPLAHCPDFSKFRQHPGRLEDGDLKTPRKPRSWDPNPASKEPPANVAAFLSELSTLCKKYNFNLMHQSFGSPLAIELWSEGDEEKWTLQAIIMKIVGQ